MNGGRGQGGLVLIDGVPATSGDWAGLIASPSVDSVQEMQIMRNSYDAQYGKSDGGVVSLVSKGGTNDFHGTLFEFLRNDNLDANSWSNNRAGLPKVEFQRNQFGGNFSGPIWRSKRLFFFGGYEGLRQGSPGVNVSNVPTELERRGDFSQTRNANGSLAMIYNPFTTRPNPGGSGFIRDPFPGNIIPANLIDPVGRNVVNSYPLPNTQGDAITNARNFAAAGKTVTVNDRFDVRVDWAKSEKYSFYTRVSKAWQENQAPVFFGNGFDSNFSDQNPRHHVTIGNTFVPTPTWVINLLIGSGRWREVQLSPSQGMDGTAIGLPASLVSQFGAPTIPQFAVNGYAQLGNSRFLDFPRETHNLQLNLTKELGTHSVKFGFAGEIARLNSTDFRSADFSFGRGLTSGPTASPDSTVSGNGIASLLLGTGASGTAPVRPGLAITQQYWAGYLHDVWRVNRRLTLNLGLRYEVQTARTERWNRLNSFNFDVANPLGQRVGLPLEGGLVFVSDDNRTLWDTDRIDLAPRIGLAFKVTDNLVIRSGYGIFYPQTVGSGSGGTDGFSNTTQWVSTAGGDGINPANLIRNPFPEGLSQPIGSSQGLETLVGNSITAWSRLHPSGYYQNFSFDIQYEIDRGTVIELGYVGTQGRKLQFGAGLNANQLHPGYLSLGTALDQQVANPFFGEITTGPMAGRTVPYHRLLRPYPHFINVNLPADTPGGWASFNAFNAKFTKQLSAGLNIITTYQWSKAMDNASETQGWEIDDGFRDYYNLDRDRGISGHDIPHSFVNTLIYELPVGKGKPFGSNLHPVVDAVIGGWQVSSIVRFSSGLPLQFRQPNNLSAYGFNLARPNISDLKELEVENQTPDNWFNTAAVTPAANYTIGNAPRWIPNLRFGPTKHADVALLKNFRHGERLNAQLRAEFFNITNTPQFGRANTTLGDANFGKVTGTTNVGPRNVQLGLRIQF
jgi:hypothetical protein